MNPLERIDYWASAVPNRLAHVSGDRQLTYAELKARSDSLAANLVELLGDNRAPVAVLGHREPEMLVAFIGAVKSGRPYIPLDTTFPQARLNQMLASAQPALVLTPEETAKLSKPGKSAPGRSVQANDPFYILFTSGSSGTPKGVIITLGCLKHFLQWMLTEHQFVERNETFLNQAPFCFDLSVMDLYCSLATGGTLFSVSRDLVANPKALYRALAHSDVTTWVSTPSFVQMCLIEHTFSRELLPHVRRYLFCGEILLPQTASLLIERFPEAQVWNTYGPTETTVATTSVRIDRDILQKYSTLPVGRPMAGSEMFLVDETGRIPAHGARGEIVIKGPNVSPGYLGRPDLTAASFFRENGGRAYRTGDWGRFQDGLLFFEGRIDGQIKLNGYRIELGDLEANLRALSIVRDAVVVPVVKKGKVQSLASFVVPANDFGTTEPQMTATLQQQLRERLPTYMMPRRFVFVPVFPMTPNGKVDRRKLAESL